MVSMPEQLLKRLLEVRDVLMFSFDFEPLDEPMDASAYGSPSPWLPSFPQLGSSVEVVARDALGGVYVSSALPASTAHCLHIDSSGQVALLGEDLEPALALLVALPYWRELLAQSASLDVMRTQAAELEREVCDDLPALPEARDFLAGFLALPQLPDPVALLHELASRAQPATLLGSQLDATSLWPRTEE